MKYWICIILFVVSSKIAAQTAITGTVMTEDKHPIDFFNAMLLSPSDSLIISGEACRNGKMQINTQQMGDVLLHISSLGYQNKIINLSLRNEAIDIGSVVLKQSTTSIDQVIVSARRPTIVNKADRMVVNVEGTILNSALDGIDMLKKTPGLSVDRTGNITVFGKGTPVVYIDNRPAQSSTEVKMLNPQNIKSIEIIDNPPAAYDAQGSAVILIHTIKRDDHYFIRLGGSLIQSRRTSAGGFAEGHWSKNKLSGGIHYSYDNNKNRDGEDGYNSPDDIHNIFYNTQSPNSEQRHQTYFSIAYTPSSKHTIGIQGTGYSARRTGSGLTDTSSDDPILHAFTTNSNETAKSWQIGTTLYYNYHIDTLGQVFKFVGDMVKLDNKSAQSYYNIVDGAPISDVPFINTNDNNGTRTLYSLKADYEKPLGKKWRIEMGAKYYLINVDNRTIQTGSTNAVQQYNSMEWNIAGYLSITTYITDKINLRYGLRAEYNDRDGQKNEVQYVKRSELDWFPSLLFEYNASKNFNMGISYTKRLNRPPLYQLDPSIISADSLLTRKGNPDLKSEKSHVFQLSFGFYENFRFTLGYNYNLYPTYFTNTRDESNPYRHNVRYINEKRSSSYAVSASYNKNICKWWSTSIYLGLWGPEYKYIDKNGIERNNNTPNWIVNTSNTFVLPWKLTWDIGFDWNSAGSWGTSYDGSYWNLYTTLRRDFLDGALSCRFIVNDIFHSSQGYQRSILPGGNWNLFDSDSRYVQLSITYKFGKSKYQHQSKSGSQTELDRIR